MTGVQTCALPICSMSGASHRLESLGSLVSSASVAKAAQLALDTSQLPSSILIDELNAQIDEQVGLVTTRDKHISKLQSQVDEYQSEIADLHALVATLQRARNLLEGCEQVDDRGYARISAIGMI